jgi:hypothetical protein
MAKRSTGACGGWHTRSSRSSSGCGGLSDGGGGGWGSDFGDRSGGGSGLSYFTETVSIDIPIWVIATRMQASIRQHTSGGGGGGRSSRGLGLGGLGGASSTSSTSGGGSRGGGRGRRRSRRRGAHVKLLLGRLLEGGLELRFQVIEGVERWIGSRELSAIRITLCV